VVHESRDMREFPASPPDWQVAKLAARQWGVVSVAQLRALGLSKDAVQRRVGAGRLHRLHHGVYAVGHTVLKREGRWLAAVLACGDGRS
jgi:predicted transcriptional regulator of viral defense system